MSFSILLLLSLTLVNPVFSAISGNLIPNGDFESGSVSPWSMAISGSGNVASLTVTSDAYSGNYAGRISVTSCNTPNPYGYIALNSPMLQPTVGETYTVTFTYKATSTFDAFFLCQTSTTQVYNKHVVCYASSSWKTVTFEVGPIPTAIKNWLTLRFNRINTITIDNISLTPAGYVASTATTTSSPTSTLTASSTAASLPSASILANGDFETGTTKNWRLYTVKNTAYLTTTTNAYAGSYAGSLKVTSYTASEPTGYVCLQNSFSATAGAKYAVSFKYKSTAAFKFFVIAFDASGKQHYWPISCSASSVWTAKTLSLTLPSTLSSSKQPWVDFRFYSLGEANIDNVSVIPAEGTTLVSTSTTAPTPTPSPTASTGGSYSSTTNVKYALWCKYQDLTNNPTQFLSRLKTGKINALIVNMMCWNKGNTLYYHADSINNFVNQVKSANPQIEVYAGIYYGSYKPDLTTATSRRTCSNALKAFWNQFSGKLAGILDDTEVYVGTKENQLAYFSDCASVLKPLGVKYYPWLFYRDFTCITAQRCAVGFYGGHVWYETMWKTAFERLRVDAAAKTGYQVWLMAEHYSDYPTVKKQLQFLDDQLALNGGWSYYPKMELLGLWWYNTLTAEDWNAWVTWVNK